VGPPIPATRIGEGERSDPSAGRSWHLPPEQVDCINLVLQLARREGRDVTIVDVDRAEGRQDLIDRWVGADDSLPILVRPDGARLKGIEQFVPRKVRQFIRAR